MHGLDHLRAPALVLPDAALPSIDEAEQGAAAAADRAGEPAEHPPRRAAALVREVDLGSIDLARGSAWIRATSAAAGASDRSTRSPSGDSGRLGAPSPEEEAIELLVLAQDGARASMTSAGSSRASIRRRGSM